MQLDAKQKRLALIGGGVLVLVLLYRWYASNRSASTSPSAGVPAPDSSQYAALSGQEQSDAAALQGQNAQIASELQTINDWITAHSGTSSGDGTVSTPGGETPSIFRPGDPLYDEIQLLIAAGQASHNGDPGLATQQPAAPPPPAPTTTTVINKLTMLPASIATHVGGPFYTWYKNVYGQAPPAMVSPNAARYVAWTKGLGKAQAAKIPFGSVYQGHF